jgi:hypothetical protein
MPDYAPDFTYRYRVHYSTSGFTHDLTVRGGVSTTGGETLAASMATAVHDFFAALQSQMASNFTFLGASWAYAGSDVFTPTSNVPAAITGAVDTSGHSPRKRATATAMPGRGADASKGRLYFWGYDQSDNLATDKGGDGWISVANDANITTAKAVADANFHTGSGAIGIWYPRFTVKINDRTLRAIRRTITI